MVGTATTKLRESKHVRTRGTDNKLLRLPINMKTRCIIVFRTFCYLSAVRAVTILCPHICL